MKKKWIDKEYGTPYMKEVDYLAEKGIKYVFVKRNGEGIRIYKYVKNSRLFNVLSNFYNE